MTTHFQNKRSIKTNLMSTIQALLIAVCMIVATVSHGKEKITRGKAGGVGFAGIDVCPPSIIDVPEILRQSIVLDSYPLDSDDEDTDGMSEDELVEDESMSEADSEDSEMDDAEISESDTDEEMMEVAEEVEEEEEQPINIEGDEISMEEDSVVTLKGDAQIVQGAKGVFADSISFDQETYQAEATGNVRFYNDGGDEISSSQLNMEVDTFIGEAQDVKVRFANRNVRDPRRSHYNFVEDYSVFAPFRRIEVPDESEMLLDDDLEEMEIDHTVYERARATASTMYFEGDEFERLLNTEMTSCPEGSSDVALRAKEIELDHAAGIGIGKSMTLRFKNIPIFYFPSATFPITDERKTGFLFPSYGYDDDSGGILEIPYYFNIAPQLDATVTPKLLAKRGLQLYTELRYLTENSNGILRGEYLPSDDIFGDDRHAFGFDHRHTIGRGWQADIELQTVSDSSYLRDFANDIDIVASSYVKQEGSVRYRDRNFSFTGKVNTYDTINDDISVSGRPYEKLPELAFDVRPQDVGPFELELESQVINFQHDDPDRTSGNRYLIKPSVSLPLKKIYGYLTPKVSVQSISYSLDTNNLGIDDDSSLSVPITSVDAGLFFEREFTKNGNYFKQTLEPRIFYVDIPVELEQESFPNFDTGSGSDTSYSHLFRENRFFGGDRVGDTRQISVGVTSRIFNEDNGDEKLRMSIGQAFYLDDREVGLTPDTPIDTSSKSNIFAELSANFNDDWSARTSIRWDTEMSELAYLTLGTNYNHSSRRNASLTYTDNRTSEQVNLAFETPLAPKVQLEASTNYSLTDSKLRSAKLNLKYDGCCWAISLGGTRSLDGTGVYKNSFLLTLEFDELGKIGGRF